MTLTEFLTQDLAKREGLSDETRRDMVAAIVETYEVEILHEQHCETVRRGSKGLSPLTLTHGPCGNPSCPSTTCAMYLNGVILCAWVARTFTNGMPPSLNPGMLWLSMCRANRMRNDGGMLLRVALPTAMKILATLPLGEQLQLRRLFPDLPRTAPEPERAEPPTFREVLQSGTLGPDIGMPGKPKAQN